MCTSGGGRLARITRRSPALKLPLPRDGRSTAPKYSNHPDLDRSAAGTSSMRQRRQFMTRSLAPRTTRTSAPAAHATGARYRLDAPSCSAVASIRAGQHRRPRSQRPPVWPWYSSCAGPCRGHRRTDYPCVSTGCCSGGAGSGSWETCRTPGATPRGSYERGHRATFDHLYNCATGTTPCSGPFSHPRLGDLANAAACSSS